MDLWCTCANRAPDHEAAKAPTGQGGCGKGSCMIHRSPKPTNKSFLRTAKIRGRWLPPISTTGRRESDGHRARTHPARPPSSPKPTTPTLPRSRAPKAGHAPHVLRIAPGADRGPRPGHPRGHAPAGCDGPSGSPPGAASRRRLGGHMPGRAPLGLEVLGRPLGPAVLPVGRGPLQGRGQRRHAVPALALRADAQRRGRHVYADADGQVRVHLGCLAGQVNAAVRRCPGPLAGAKRSSPPRVNLQRAGSPQGPRWRIFPSWPATASWSLTSTIAVMPFRRPYAASTSRGSASSCLMNVIALKSG